MPFAEKARVSKMLQVLVKCDSAKAPSLAFSLSSFETRWGALSFITVIIRFELSLNPWFPFVCLQTRDVGHTTMLAPTIYYSNFFLDVLFALTGDPFFECTEECISANKTHFFSFLI
jgi:hypothetical protein